MKKILIITTLLLFTTCLGTNVQSKQTSRFSIRPNSVPSENVIEPRMRHQVTRVCNGKLDIYVPDSEIERGVNYTFTATLNIQDSNGQILSANWTPSAVTRDVILYSYPYDMVNGYPLITSSYAQYKPVVGLFMSVTNTMYGAAYGGIWTVYSDGPR